ncbi:MAG: hypothetical protein ACSLEM_04935 [Candidatus Malihini olakiniferum]
MVNIISVVVFTYQHLCAGAYVLALECLILTGISLFVTRRVERLENVA